MDLIVRLSSRKPLVDVESDDASGSPMKGRGTVRRSMLEAPHLLEAKPSELNSATTGEVPAAGDGNAELRR